MPTHKLNDSFIRAYPAEETEVQLHDSLVAGLTVRVYPSGYKSFVYRYKINGNSQTYTIGKYGTITLADARDVARELALKVSNGIDPIAEKKKRQRESESITFGELADNYKDIYFRQLSDASIKHYRTIIDNELNVLDDIHLSELQKQDIVKLLDAKAEKHPTMANRIMAVCSSMLSYAEENGLAESNIIKGKSKYKTNSKSRDRFYSFDEISILWNQFEAMPDPARSAFKLLLLTGQRKTETITAKWEHIDSTKQIWTIPAERAKNSSRHEVPLTDTVMKLLEELKTGYSGTSDYLFPSPSPRVKSDKPIGDIKNQKKNIQDTTKVDDFTIHDLRRTVATYMGKLQIKPEDIGRVLNHKQASKQDSITSIYNRYDYLKEKRNALQKWNNLLMVELAKSAIEEGSKDSIVKGEFTAIRGNEKAESKQPKADNKPKKQWSF